ncbi:MAG: S8 family serine peptidase [Deltaproteobacteria bacterium]|nr:S8 family serine peptidase [Deltaproteobacteria bacterium]
MPPDFRRHRSALRSRRAAALSACSAVLALLAVSCSRPIESDRSDPAPSPFSETLTTPSGATYRAHEVIARRKPSVSPAEFETAIRAVGGTPHHGASPLTAVLGFVRFSLPATITADTAIAALQAAGVAQSAERDYVVSFETTPNDPMYGQQWGLARMKAPDAWALGTGAQSMLVGVADTGVSLDHLDLAANLAINDQEIPGNNVDDDQNGFVDDLRGWDFVQNDNLPADDHGHGTHVAGIIGAVGNNALGVTGVNWQVRILPVKVCDAKGSCYASNIAEGIAYAAKRGVRVLNISAGGFHEPLSYELSAIDLLRASGGILVAAAGNSAANTDVTPHYPSCYARDNVISVAATDSSDKLASFSNWGPSSVHVGAPGVAILSTVPGNQLASMSGTSMASPMVAGAAALYASQHPDASPPELRSAVLSSVEVVPSLQGKVATGGRVDLLKLMSGTNPCASSKVDCDSHATCSPAGQTYTCTCNPGWTGSGKVCSDVDECASTLTPCAPEAECTNTPGSYTCACKAGYAGDGKTCADFDECKAGTAQCDPNATCTNAPGTYLCTCKIGFEGSGKTCTDVDECSEGTAQCPGITVCHNTPGSYECQCPQGYESQNGTCGDLDECAAGLASCDPHAACFNAEGSYTCICLPGYAGDGFFCSDVDECVPGINDCDAHADCLNKPGSYLCTCWQGWAGDGKTCSDVDECALGIHGCSSNATCTNSQGGYGCTCKPGYSGDGKTCTDVDECAKPGTTCPAHAQCKNLKGGYTCVCVAGWAGDGTTCTDVDECTDGTHGCSAQATCTNTPGAYTCTCKAGYQGDGKTCTDVDECAAPVFPCSGIASCTNLDGTFSCVCKSGFSGNGKTCTDIDECALGTDDCSADATCTNTSGGYTCTCKPPLVGDGKTCTDPNECALGTDDCSPDAICTNTKTGFTCTCKQGYSGDGKTCTDIDECIKGTHNCDPNAYCKNSPGNYSCRCKNGYGGGGFVCEDIDECATGTHDCSPMATCTNTTGGYSCACKAGYSGNGKTCTDLDECALGTHGCSPNATCTNTSGSYACTCKVGYTGDGKSCTDIDECSLPAGVCSPDASCSNTPGSYTCTCKAGFTGNGVVCTDVDECKASPCAAQAVCLNLSGTYKCGCKPGFVGDGTSCQDVNECVASPSPCDAHATCTNLQGGYACACNSGYYGTGKTCAALGDPDECVLGTHTCSPMADCFNTTGGYQCVCKKGYEGDGHACTDVDECAAGTDDCDEHAGCTNLPGSWSCACVSPWIGDGKSCFHAPCAQGFDYVGGACVDIDECSLGKHDCSVHATCTNTPGSWQCQCKSPYSGNGKVCLADECALGLDDCDVHATCKDEVEGYTCICASGWTGSGKVCVDVDECATNTSGCSKNAECTNLPGSWSCVCKSGYTGDGKTCVEPPKQVVALDARGDHTCAVVDNGAVRCWGRNTYGQLGYGHTNAVGDDESADSSGYVAVGGAVKQVSAGVSHTCVVLETGSVRCWGRNAFGQLGYGHTSNVGDDELPWTAGDVSLGAKALEVAAGGEHTCVLLEGGDVRCWGLGIHGQTGHGNTASIGDDELPGAAGAVSLGGAAVHLAAGRDHTCALLQDGSVRCWGRGQWGNLGLGNTADLGDDELPTSAPAIQIGSGAVAITAGWYHSCALLAAGDVRCWGYGAVGQLGYASTASVGDDEVPVSQTLVQLGGSVTALSAGLFHTCAVLSNGSVRCWGYGDGGRLGYGSTFNVGDDESPASMPAVQVGGTVKRIAAGGAHTCALMAAGSVRCWGESEFGQLGQGSVQSVGDDEHPSGAKAVMLSEVDECALEVDNCSAHATCANTLAGFSCTCMSGYAGNGVDCLDIDECQEGTAGCDVHATCVNAPGSVSCTCNSGWQGSGKSCTDVDECVALQPCDPHASCKNVQGSYQCTCEIGYAGDGHVCTALADYVTAAAAGDAHTCVLLASGAVRCWGLGAGGILGYGNTKSVGDSLSPASAGNVAVGGQIAQIAAGAAHTCALLASGKVRCWGQGAAGRLGYGNTQSIGDDETPSAAGDVPIGAAATLIATGGEHTCAVLTGGGVRCWGRGDAGRLGYGNTSSIGDDESPSTQPLLPLGGPVVQLALGKYHSCALLTNGEVKCWGFGGYGQLGRGSTATIGDDETLTALGPVALGGAAVQIAAGEQHTCALLANGAVRCWGYGFHGALGYGNPETVGDDEVPSAAGDVPVGRPAVEIAAGGLRTCALTIDHTVRCWGNGEHGALGYGNTSAVGATKVPSAVGDISLGGAVYDVALGGRHGCAVLATGLRCWGYNATGQLGLGNTQDVGDDELPTAVSLVNVLGP